MEELTAKGVVVELMLMVAGEGPLAEEGSR